MEFRPCIDIHNGKVKQIVGGSLADENNRARENFVSKLGAEFYAALYRDKGVTGGHIIILNPAGSEYYEADRQQAFAALEAFPGGMQTGGGITAHNAAEYLDRGASHVIVTSYVFLDGQVNFDNLKKLSLAVGRERLVIDLSCRARDGGYYIVTDRWQKFTDVPLDGSTLDMFAEYCDEFLVHAADAEGKSKGVESSVAEILGSWAKKNSFPVTYAGGIGSRADLDELKRYGKDRLNFTVGSALDIFGGTLDFEEMCGYK